MVFEQQILTVSQLNLFIKDILAQIPILNDIRIKGEISNFKHHSSGHMYMTIKDETGVLRAVMFKSAAMTLNFTPQNGMQVVARGRVAVYERDGQYQLYINSMEQDGKGNLYAKFEKLKEKLRQEGLFDSVNKKSIPSFPKKIGVVTAPTGAAVRDIINIISRRFSCADICLYPAMVQGDGAAASIKNGIEYFNKTKSVDVLIVGRGGGSIEDLWAFNEELTARAIFESEIPVISAVGHETDFTIADFVADLRAATPSAAAELVVPSQDELLRRIDNIKEDIASKSRKIIENKRLMLKVYREKQIFKDPVYKINEKSIYLDHLYKLFENATSVGFSKKTEMFKIMATKLNDLSPLNTISRGYSITKNNKGELVKSVTQVSTGDEISVIVSDGEIKAEAK